MSPSIAYLFPGQGRIPDALPPASERVDRLLAVAEEHGLSLRGWIEDGRDELLALTANAQPALLIDSLGREQALQAAGWIPSAVAGHSLGEYGALVCAGVLDAGDALGAVIERGRAMSGVEGTMAAILKLDVETIEALCEQVGPSVCVANHNGPTQVVVSGDRAAVKDLAERAADLGARAVPLQVSGPFHSPAMRPAQVALEPTLRALAFRVPKVPVVSSVTATAEEDPETLREILCGQITARVRWVDAIRQLEALGVTVAVEVGSGDVLTRLGRRMATKVRFLTFEEAVDGRA
jgi:[acyl-carrier-protein] S-malonyltransferase